jgi:hypothetical protein
VIVDLVAYGAFFLTMALVYAIICLGLNVQWGQTGLFNVGVAGFVAIGGYVSALLTTPDTPGRFGGFDWPIFAGWIGGAAAAGLFSFLIGALTIRCPLVFAQFRTPNRRRFWRRLHSSTLCRSCSAAPFVQPLEPGAAHLRGLCTLSRAGAIAAQPMGARLASHPRR